MKSDKQKAIFMSKQFFFDKSNQFKESGRNILDLFNQNNIVVAILAQRQTIGVLSPNVPSEYKDNLKFISRDRSKWHHVNDFQRKGNMVAIVGVVQEDAIFAFQSKIPLFNPSSLGFDVDTKIDQYGLPIACLQDIIDCYKAFEIHQDNYFRMDFADDFTVVSLNNANTLYRPLEEARIKEIFKANLKGDIQSRNHKILLLLLFHLVNEVTTNVFYEEVDYWGTFPSSNPANTLTSISFLKESVRCIVGGGPRKGAELFLRIKEKPPKHLSGTKKYSDKGKEDFETLIVNPQHYSKIKGKVICIIDDYITTGYSSEVAKTLLFAAGARKVIFLSIGKFGKKYFSTNYDIQGNVSKHYAANLVGEVGYGATYNGHPFYNYNNETEILKFGNIL